jgi:DNA-binding NarL/FixJ family response regulator
VTSLPSSFCVAAATSSTAWAKASSFARDGFEEPLTFRTYCNAAAAISSSVAGGSKLWSVLMFLHMGPSLAAAPSLGEPPKRVDAVIPADVIARTRPVTLLCFDSVAIRIVLAEDNYLVREGVRRLLEEEPEVDVVATCVDRDSLLEAVERDHPDVVLTDIRMPPNDWDEGIRVADELRDSHPEIGVVVLSQFVEPQYALALLDRGADRRAYLLKERVRDLSQLVAAIREVAAGGSVIDPKVVEALVAAKSRLEKSPLSELTPRERQILEEIAQGKSNAAIAQSLVLAERSVEKVIHSIFLKLGLTWQPDINRRVKAVLVFLAEQDALPETTRAR